MIRYLGKDAHLVSYGAMSKQPLSLPTSAFIFKNLTAHGFWQSHWYTERSVEEREGMMESLTQLIRDGKVGFSLICLKYLFYYFYSSKHLSMRLLQSRRRTMTIRRRANFGTSLGNLRRVDMERKFFSGSASERKSGLVQLNVDENSMY
jgi:hypothetical protein